MAFNKDKPLQYSIRGKSRILEEKGNNYIKMAYIAWGVSDEDEVEDSKICLDIRKYTTDTEGNEKMLKGVSFKTKEGPDELTHALVEDGYGNTEKVLEVLSNRSDFGDSVKSLCGEKVEIQEDGSFDLREILNS